MFGRRFAYQRAAAQAEPREYDWWQLGHGWLGRGWAARQRLHLHMRRNFFGRGPFGQGDPEGPFGEDDAPAGAGWGKRFLGRGDLKYALLELLQERPMHGYEMMKALQERTGGMYTPSAGSVYPTLQMLEDRGFVTVSEVDGKKVYTITDDGRAFLAEGQQEERGDPRRRFWQASREDWNEMAAIMSEMRGLQPLLMHTVRCAVIDPKKLKRLRKLVDKLRAELEEIAREPAAPEG
jgi:DNA-binding PadR family transcriptional regulator